MNNEQINPWTCLQKQVAYDNPWITVEHHDVLNPSGNPGIYGKVCFKNLAIGIIPIDDKGYTWLVGQFRYTLNAYSWEIPEGGGNMHIPPEESARRELIEECGLKTDSLTEIMRMHLSNSVTDELAIIYVAKQLTLTQAEPEDSEQLQIRYLPFEEAYQMTLRGEITDAMSVGGILKTKLLLDAQLL